MAGKESGEAFGLGKGAGAGNGAGSDADLTPMLQNVHLMHEFYTGLVGAGFEEYAALWIMGAMVKGLPMPEWLSERLHKPEGGA